MDSHCEAKPGRSWLDRWGMAVLAGVLMLLFVRSLSPDLTMANGDAPLLALRDTYQTLPYGLIARWAEEEGMGAPGTALGLTPNTLIGWIVPYGKNADLNYMLHLLVFGLGGWLLIRDMTRSALAATLGGLWFMLQPHAFTHMLPGHMGYFWTCAWMPWCLLFLRYAVRNGHSGWWVLAGACGGLNLTGQPDIGVLFLLFAAVYGVFLVVRKGMVSEDSDGRRWRFVAGVLAKSVLAGVACLLVGFQILFGTFNLLVSPKAEKPAAAEVKAQPDAGQSDEKWWWATQWSVPVEESLDFVIPGLFGWGSSHPSNPYRGRVGQTEGFPAHRQGLPNLNDISNYVGAFMTLACVVAVVARRRSAEVWFLVVAVLAACLLAFGKHAPFYRLFYELPYMSAMRNPIKWFAIASLCVGMLGSIGLAELFSKETILANLSRFKKLALCFVPGVVVVAGGALFLTTAGKGPGALFWQNPRAVAQGWDALMVAVFCWGAAGAVCLWALSRRSGSSAGAGKDAGTGILMPVAAGLLLFEVLYVDLRYMPYNSTDLGVRSDAISEFLNSQERPFRVQLATMAGAYRFIQTVLCPYYRWERPYVSASRTEDASSVFLRGFGADPKKMLQLANVHYVLAPNRIGDPAFVPMVAMKYGDTPVIVHRFTNALPRYYAVGRWEAVPEESAMERMAAKEFDPRQSVFVHAPPDVVPAPPAATEAASCDIVEYTWHRVRLKVKSTHNVMVVGLERHDKSWSAFVDGKPIPMWKANFMLRALPVPAGEHEVVLRLVGDGGFGFWVGVAGWVMVALAGGWLAVGAFMNRRRLACGQCGALP